MNQITITLRQIEAHDPCQDGWEKIKAATHLHGGDFDKPFPLAGALDTNGLDDVLWALQCLPEHANLWRKFAVWCARQVQHLMTDQRSLDALDVAWRHSNGEATDDQLRAAWEDALAAVAAARAAGDAAWGAAWAAARAAGVAAWVAAREAAGDAAWGARAARAAQASKLRQILEAGEWVEDGQAELVEVSDE